MPLLISANLGRHVDTAEFLANVRRLDDEAGTGTVIGFQEIDELDTPNEHHGLRTVLDGFDFAGRDTREPIALGPRWTKHHDNVTKGAPGLARLSPARTITETLAVHHSGAELVFLNLHYPRNDPALLERWQQLRAAHRERINRHHAEGRTVVWFSDVNRTRFTPLHPAERTLAHKGLDWIRCVEHPKSAQLNVVDHGLIPLSIDGHDAPWVRVELHTPNEHR
jgi:hypothetical protein